MRRSSWPIGRLPHRLAAAILLAVSAAAYGAMVTLGDQHAQAMRLCVSVAGLSLWSRLARLLAFASQPWAAMLTADLLMVVAMMTPLLLVPIQVVLTRSFVSRRLRSGLLVSLGYILTWLVAVLGWLVWLTAGLALLWQVCPARLRFVWACHRLPRLEPFGLRADLSCFQYGVAYGLNCVVTCAPLMLFAVLAPLHFFICVYASCSAFIERALKRPPILVLTVGLAACALTEIVATG
jgi:hypothetical protein